MVHPNNLPDIIALQDEIYRRFGDNVGSLAIEWLVNETLKHVGREIENHPLYDIMPRSAVRSVCKMGEGDEKAQI